MEPVAVKQLVCEVLAENQKALGLGCPPLNDGSKPLKDLPDFDSPTSIALTGMIRRRLGIASAPKKNLFGDKNSKYTIEETVGILCGWLKDEAKNEVVHA